ncbi:hypothetical protein ACFTWD_35770 [Streptomyces sp. NPDC056943]|uniref:hypothetical protein n=1 Tax=Streptomyces sp. NPDC056943 TaxID=3345971 RepID=UPI003627FAD1
MSCVPDDARHLELDLITGQRKLVNGVVPDEHPAREPTISFTPRAGHTDLPYGVTRWFTDQVDTEIRTSRAWMRLRPDLVTVIHQLRQEHMAAIDEADLPHVLAELKCM